ncbi:GIY-YIG nuclease family protein [Tissierella creatinophila]|uniref:UvrABC system protein C n=1 Tax=Tissierella creatinophila DSM 6911 TaxID=1123403 RepID=A0A1U7M5I9_TISCR|nr:GIY-YIG nuclease family protein [Tissierella creatinophila]OLS02520.1 UvrABC system protein C [Tissierella creatinophila DSM 6911]
MIYINKSLKTKILSLPESPGIYKMLDKEKNIIYIGKSISLKKRVRTYFSEKPKWEKVKKLTPLIDDIEYIVTDTHLEARLLECEMIKRIKPIFNSQFKNDKGYVYLNIKDYNIYNPISIVYDYEEKVYGPFRRKFRVLMVLEALKNLYPILKVDEKYQFSYDVFPVKMDRETFNLNKRSLENIFSNDREFTLFLKSLDDKMIEASKNLQFETAMTYRDTINGLNYLKGSLKEDKNLFLKKLFINIPLDKGNKFFLVSRGKILLKETFLEFNETDIEHFIERALSLKALKENPFEKASLDFRDIIYSEIRTLPKDIIRVIN